MGICQTKDKRQGVTDSKAVIEPEKVQKFEIGNEAPQTKEGVDLQTLEEQKEKKSLQMPVSHMKDFGKQAAPLAASAAAGGVVGAATGSALEDLPSQDQLGQPEEFKEKIESVLEEQIPFQEIPIEDWVIEHSTFYTNFENDWDQILQSIKNNKPIDEPSFKKIKKSRYTDKNITQNKSITNVAQQEKYLGSMLGSRKHGPGSLLKDQGKIQIEGIWIDDHPVGKSVYLTIDEQGSIIGAMECYDGQPKSVITLDARTRSESHKQVPASEQIAERKGSDAQGKPAGAGTGGHESESIEAAGGVAHSAPAGAGNPGDLQPHSVKI